MDDRACTYTGAWVHLGCWVDKADEPLLRKSESIDDLVPEEPGLVRSDAEHKISVGVIQCRFEWSDDGEAAHVRTVECLVVIEKPYDFVPRLDAIEIMDDLLNLKKGR